VRSQWLRKELAPQVGLEPTTLRLTAECSAIELLRSVGSACLPCYHSIRPRTLKIPIASTLLRCIGPLNCIRRGVRWS
jgi:hypothetical protein